jgi:hypothetical protein
MLPSQRGRAPQLLHFHVPFDSPCIKPLGAQLQLGFFYCWLPGIRYHTISWSSDTPLAC